jgi:hypothetical protein
VTVRIRSVVAVSLAVAGVLSVGGYVAWHALSPRLPLRLPTPPACMVSAAAGAPPSASAAESDVTLDPEQMANASTIAAVGIRRGVPTRAVQVALATALQESKLRNLAGGDRDSIGLFQQRPSQGWGTPEQIADPRYAANSFYITLMKVPGWQTMRVTQAAQAVQRSGAPEAYDRWVDESDVLARALVGDAAGAVACDLRDLRSPPDQRGAAAANALAGSLRLDWGGRVSAARSNDVVGVEVTATDSRAGWQYAHWLVAHAADQGVRRVRYGDREWTAKGGDWARASAAPATGTGRVVAEVYPATSS